MMTDEATVRVVQIVDRQNGAGDLVYVPEEVLLRGQDYVNDSLMNSSADTSAENNPFQRPLDYDRLPHPTAAAVGQHPHLSGDIQDSSITLLPESVYLRDHDQPMNGGGGMENGGGGGTGNGIGGVPNAVGLTRSGSWMSSYMLAEMDRLMFHAVQMVSSASSVGQQLTAGNGHVRPAALGRATTSSSSTNYVPEDDGNDNIPTPTNEFTNDTLDKFGFRRSASSSNDNFIGNESNLSSSMIRTLRNRETKWLDMLNDWPHYMNRNFDKVRNRCRKGIPMSLRGRVWIYLCGAQHYMIAPQSRNSFERLDAQPGDPKWNDDIQKDIFRQFPDHELFARQSQYGSFGRSDLFRLLKAYTVLHPDEGYCQGQAPVAATLLMHMPLKDAFYCFVQICHKYLPGYYSPGLEAIQLDGMILQRLLKRKAGRTFKHFKATGVEPVLYMVEWFMCIYCRTLPWPAVLRVWDMFFCEGVKVLFKVAVVLLRATVGSSAQLKRCTDLHSTMELVKSLPADLTQPDALVQKICNIEITEEELEKSHFKEWKIRNKQKKGIISSQK